MNPFSSPLKNRLNNMNTTSHTAVNCGQLVGRLVASMALILGLLATTPASRATSSPPDRMTYQGFLVNGSGDPLAPTSPVNYPVVFRIYDASDSGNLIWSEQQVVTVDKGNFSVVLGEGAAVSSEPHDPLSTIFAGTSASDRFMGITVTVGANTLNLSPRLRLLPSPYSYLASQAGQLVNPSTGVSYLNAAAGTVNIVGNINANGVINASGGVTGLTAGQIPNLDASQIASGNFDSARIPTALTGTRSFTGGNIGIGTASPTATLAVLGSTSPALFVDNGGGANWAAKFETHGANLIIRPVSSGSTVQIIENSAGGLALNPSGGNVGIGRTDPSATLHVNGSMKIDGGNTLEFGAGIAGKEGNAGKIGYGTFSGGSTLDIVGAGPAATGLRSIRIFAENGTFMGDNQILFRGYNDHNHGVGYVNNNFGVNGWDGAALYGFQNVVLATTIGGGKWIMYASNNGNCYARLVFVNFSDKNGKENFQELNCKDVLAKVAAMPVTRWNYKESPDAQHIGPVAQDFHEAFQLNGDDDKHITTVDESGIALAAIKGLNQVVQEKDAEIQSLKQDMQQLRQMVDQLVKSNAGRN
jgi:hypothetical protein